MKLSFGITCMNRLHQLKKTLHHNLMAIEPFDGVELCLVNFNSQDGLDKYIAENFMHHIESRKLNYFHTQSPQYFHCSMAKNVAHRLGSGSILYNLDGDNFITEINVEKILSAFNQSDGVFLHEMLGTYPGNSDNGTYGRIALTKKDFYLLRGYDEKLLGVSQHDTDLINRLNNADIRLLAAQSEIKQALLNDKTETMANLKMKLPYSFYDQTNLFLIYWRNLLRKSVNPNGMKKFYGRLNFKEYVEI